MPTESHSRSTSSSWWLEKITGTPPLHRSCSTVASASTAIGSSPENGSSRMSTSGSCTSATASCTRCWLPSDSACTVSPLRSVSPSRSSRSSVAFLATGMAMPCRRPKYSICSATRIFWYRPRSSGM